MSKRKTSGIDPFDPRYANVPLDIPITHVEDYVTRTNSKNDQDHLHSQIMHFKKEFGAFISNKPTKKTTTKSTTTTNTSTNNNNNNNDDHKDQNNTNNNNQNNDDMILPNINSIESMRSAMARFEAWQYQRHSQLMDDFREFETENASSFALFQSTNNHNNNSNNNHAYVTPFYNPFLRILTNDDSNTNNNDDDNKQDLDVNMINNNNEQQQQQQSNAMSSQRMRRLFPRSHYAQNRQYGTSQTQTNNHSNQNNNAREARRASRERILQRYRYFNRYRNTIRAMHYYNIRQRLRARAQQQNDDNNHNNHNNDNDAQQPNFLHLAPYFDQLQNENEQRISQIVDELSLNLDISSILDNDDHNASNSLNLSNLISPKVKHVTPSRLDGLSDFKAAFALIPLRLTCKNPFNQTIYQKINNSKHEMDEEDEDDCKQGGGDVAISGIDNRQNLLSQLSADLHLIILNMLTGLGNMRTIAIYKSLRSELSAFDIQRVAHCSVYKCQALFVERYRQNLFDEKYKALQQPALTRALSDEPRNLFEFQQDRKKMVLRRQSSSESNQSMQCDFDERMVTI